MARGAIKPPAREREIFLDELLAFERRNAASMTTVRHSIDKLFVSIRMENF
jgi:hypothetical protein